MITITSNKGGVINLTDRGIHVELGGIEDFLSTAAIKTPPTTHWYEGDGAEADLEHIELQPRDVKIPLIATDPKALQALAAELIERQSFALIHHTGVQRQVYLERVELITKGAAAHHKMELTVKEYAPTPPREEQATAIKATPGEPKIDGRALSAYGFRKLETDNRTHYAKDGVMINRQYHPRLEPNNDTHATKLTLIAEGENCIKNYQALIHRLTTPGEHTLDDKRVYYKQARVDSYSQKAPHIIITVELQTI